MVSGGICLGLSHTCKTCISQFLLSCSNLLSLHPSCCAPLHYFSSPLLSLYFILPHPCLTRSVITATISGSSVKTSLLLFPLEFRYWLSPRMFVLTPGSAHRGTLPVILFSLSVPRVGTTSDSHGFIWVHLFSFKF